MDPDKQKYLRFYALSAAGALKILVLAAGPAVFQRDWGGIFG